MFNNRFNSTKKDPLVEAVQSAMQDGEIRRQAVAQVNEEFGVYSRKAVVREQLAAYDARLEEAYKCMKEGEKLAKKDYDKDGKVESPKDEVWGSRFRAAKMAGKMEEEQIDELKKPTPETALKVVNRANDRDEWSAKAANRLYSRYKKGYEPKEKKTEVKEETLEELSQKTLKSYERKAEKSLDSAINRTLNYKERKTDAKTVNKRFAGLKLADKKIQKEETQIDEISKELAGRYIKQADYKRSDSSFQSGKVYGKELATKRRTKQDVETSRKHNRDAFKREKGIDTAVNKLTGKAKVQAREEVDYSAPDRAAVTRDNKPSTPAQTNAATSGPSAADKAALASKISTMKEAAYSAKAARAGKDIGKPGKSFSKIAKSAGEKYGSEERGKKVAGAILKRIRAKHMKEDTNE